MGKGKRKSEQTLQKELEKQQKHERENKKRRLDRIISISLAAVAVLVIGGIIAYYNITARLEQSGHYLRTAVSLECGDIKTDNAMLFYYYYQTVRGFINTNSEKLENLGLNTTTPLYQQSCYYDSKLSWRDYFFNDAKKQVVTAMRYRAAAAEQGMTLDDAEKETISQRLAEYEAAAKASDKSISDYLADEYGKGVSLDDVQRCLEADALAGKYYNSFAQSLKYTDNVIDNYYQNNRADFDVFSAVSFSMTETTDGKEATEGESRELAQALISAQSAAQFKQMIYNYYEERYKNTNQDYTKEGLQNLVDECVVENSAISADADKQLRKWLATAKAGETAMFKSADDGMYTAYYCTKGAHRETYTTKNMRHILLTAAVYGSPENAKEKALSLERVLANAENAEKSFTELALKYSEDSATAKNGGRYFAVKKDDMPFSIEDWLYSPERKKGEMTVLMSDTGYHVIRFEGDNAAAYRADVVTVLKSKDIESMNKKLEKKYKIKENADLCALVR